jgi:hypothetical protein
MGCGKDLPFDMRLPCACSASSRSRRRVESVRWSAGPATLQWLKPAKSPAPKQKIFVAIQADARRKRDSPGFSTFFFSEKCLSLRIPPR